MNRIDLPSNETVYFEYRPESDELTIRLSQEQGATREETLPHYPLVSLVRAAGSGELVELRLRSVQQFLLHNLVRDLVNLARTHLMAEAATETVATDEQVESAPATPEATRAEEAPARPARKRTRKKAEEAPETVEATPAEAVAEGEAAAQAEEAPAKPARKRRTRKKAEEAVEAAVEAIQPEGEAEPAAQGEEAPAKPTRKRRTRKKVEEAPEAAESTPAEAVAEAEEAPARPARKRRTRKKAEEAVEAAVEAIQPEGEAEPAAQAEEAPAKPTRKRRTRKKAEEAPEAAESTPAEAVAEGEAATQAEAAPAKPARKRRTRKKAEEAPETIEATPAEAVAEGEVEAAAQAEEAPEAAESTPAEAVAEGEVEAAAQAEEAPEAAESTPTEAVAEGEVEAAAQAEAAPAKPARKRRTRKKKVETPEMAEAASEGAGEAAVAEPTETEEAAAGEAAAEEAPTKPARKRRTRKRGAKAKEEAERPTEVVEPTAETQAAPAEELPAQEAEEEKPAKRKRRRRRKRGKGTAEQPVAEPTAATEAPDRESAPQEDGGKRTEEEPDEPPRRSYKSKPIPGLEAPEAFAFMKMHSLLGQAIAALGFESPTPIQRRAVPVAMEGRDVIGLAQTGTGKTMAFLIPALHKLMEDKNKRHRPRLLVLTPTRELAVQVSEEAEFLATHTDLRITTVYGGVNMKRQTNDLKRGTDVIVATPGRLLDHLNRGNVSLKEIQVFVLDEADRMLDMGFLPDIRLLLRYLPKERQTFLFSATMPPAIQSLSLDFQQNPEVIEVARQLPPTSIDQQIYPVERHLKVPLLEHLLKQDEGMQSVLVFTETKAEADVLTRKLREAGINTALMHGDRNQRERERALQQLREGSVRVLVATDVAARGLDIPEISHVVNYDIPQSADDYVHRIGRTARGKAEGKAYTFVATGDEGMLKRIESALERELPRIRAEGFDYDVPVPSWAKPTADEIIEKLHKPKGLADRFRRMMRRR